mmetsp:Transcript_24193/g.84006  ORF Transcript_24193/g.84006 Transcript_24193/m.84006 type:complete len:206 (+) Transcript_24193:831-1448(+)
MAAPRTRSWTWPAAWASTRRSPLRSRAAGCCAASTRGARWTCGSRFSHLQRSASPSRRPSSTSAARTASCARSSPPRSTSSPRCRSRRRWAAPRRRRWRAPRTRPGLLARAACGRRRCACGCRPTRRSWWPSTATARCSCGTSSASTAWPSTAPSSTTRRRSGTWRCCPRRRRPTAVAGRRCRRAPLSRAPRTRRSDSGTWTRWL